MLGDLKQQSRRWLLFLSLLTAAGSALGSTILLATPSSAFDLVVPVLVLFASLLLAGQRQVKKLASRNRTAGEGGRTRWRSAGIAIGAASVYGGYFAGALGVIMLAVLAVTTSDGLRALNAVKVALSMVHSTVTLLAFAFFGPVSWWTALLAAPSTLVGGFVGAKLAQRMNEETLRWCVVGLGIAVSSYLFVS